MKIKSLLLGGIALFQWTCTSNSSAPIENASNASAVNFNVAPKCSNADVNEMVINYFKEQIKKSYYPSGRYYHLRFPELNIDLDSVAQAQTNKKMIDKGWTMEVIKCKTWDDYREAHFITDSELQKNRVPYVDEFNRVLNEHKKYETDYIEELRGTKEEINDRIADEFIQSLHLNLSNIRPVQVDDRIKKCECASDLLNEQNEVVTVNYSAQYTEDGKLYVTVDGINH